MFTILGDDGVECFGHLHNLADKKEFKHFFYKGSRCSFDTVDERELHLKAIDRYSSQLERKAPSEKYRVKKCTIHTIGSRTMAKEL